MVSYHVLDSKGKQAFSMPHSFSRALADAAFLLLEVDNSCTMFIHQPVPSTSLSSDGFFVWEELVLTEHPFHG